MDKILAGRIEAIRQVLVSVLRVKFMSTIRTQLQISCKFLNLHLYARSNVHRRSIPTVLLISIFLTWTSQAIAKINVDECCRAYAKSVATRFGGIEILSSYDFESAETRDLILLNGKVLVSVGDHQSKRYRHLQSNYTQLKYGRAFFIGIQAYVQLPDGDLLVAATADGGTKGRPERNFVIFLREDHKVLIQESPEFFSYQYRFRLKRTGDLVKIDLGIENKAHKYAIIEHGHLRFEHIPSKEHVSREDCLDLFNDTEYTCAKTFINRECKLESVEFLVREPMQLETLNQFSGFSETQLEIACAQVCAAQTALTETGFLRNVCGRAEATIQIERTEEFLKKQNSQLKEAIRLYSENIDKAPWLPMNYYYRAISYAAIGDYTNAMLDMQHLLKLEPTSIKATEAKQKIEKWKKFK